MSYIKKEFFEMKKNIGEKNYDLMNIITGTLFHDAVIFMKKVGILEEFLEDKNKASHIYIENILKMEEEKDHD